MVINKCLIKRICKSVIKEWTNPTRTDDYVDESKYEFDMEDLDGCARILSNYSCGKDMKRCFGVNNIKVYNDIVKPFGSYSYILPYQGKNPKVICLVIFLAKMNSGKQGIVIGQCFDEGSEGRVSPYFEIGSDFADGLKDSMSIKLEQAQR